MAWFGEPSTITSATVQNGAVINVTGTRPMPSTIYSGTGNPFTIATALPAAIMITNPSTNLPSVTIHHNGEVEYKGKPSQAAEAFYKALGANINIKAAGKQALEKTYRRAIERCLNQAKSMSHEDFIAMLENELDTRNSKAVLMRLAEDENNAE